MSSSPRWLPRLALVAAAAVALPACEINLNTQGLTAREKRTFAVTATPDLTLETFDGAIEIHSWDRNEVEVEVEKRGMEQGLIDAMRIEAQQDGDRIVLRVTGPEQSTGHRAVTIGVHVSTSARLLVAVPRKSLVNARTGDGSISVESIDGRVVLNTSDGSVTADRTAGELQVRTGDGAIRLSGVEGTLDLDTEDGSVTVEGKPGSLRAHTGDGAIRLQIDDGSVMRDAWDIATRDGSVTVSLPESFHAEVDAATSDGSVRSSHPALSLEESAGSERRESRRELRARMGEGGPILKIRTGDGSIRFER